MFQARIVAMTCTHAAMTRSRLVELGFKYDRFVLVLTDMLCCVFLWAMTKKKIIPVINILMINL